MPAKVTETIDITKANGEADEDDSNRITILWYGSRSGRTTTLTVPMCWSVTKFKDYLFVNYHGTSDLPDITDEQEWTEHHRVYGVKSGRIFDHEDMTFKNLGMTNTKVPYNLSFKIPVGGGMPRRKRQEVTDFAVKEDDPVPIKTLLTYKAPAFQKSIADLTEPQRKAWCDFTTRQKNFERVIDYTINEMAMNREFDVWASILTEQDLAVFINV